MAVKESLPVRAPTGAKHKYSNNPDLRYLQSPFILVVLLYLPPILLLCEVKITMASSLGRGLHSMFTSYHMYKKVHQTYPCISTYKLMAHQEVEELVV